MQSAAYGNYSGWVGSARLTCDYKAISVQLQLQLSTGTELGNMSLDIHINKFLDIQINISLYIKSNI